MVSDRQAIGQIVEPKPTPVTLPAKRMGGQWLGRISGVVFTVLCFWSVPAEVVQANQVQNRELQIGVVQRFGTKPGDKLILKAVEGDRLYVRFEGGDGTPQTQEVNEIQLEIVMKPLAEPILEERLVLSTHRSFENAEQNAEEWRKKGIEVEIAHPGRWQVWAQREVYGTPLLRRLLLQNLQAEGYKTAFLDTEIIQNKPQPSWVFEGFRYNRDRLEIWAGSDRIQVSREKEDRNPTLYPGKLRVQPNAYGSFTLVNKVQMEDYLR
jgi:hypothetical protein